MKPVGAFFIPFFLGVAFAGPLLSGADSSGLRFRGAPSAERFAGGALQVVASVACPDPVAVSGARVDFGLDFDLDGVFDPAGSSALFPGDCENGALTVRRDLFPRAAAALRLELRAPLDDGADAPALEPGASAKDTLRDSRVLFTGDAGALLALRRFCARPRNGEPEWVEVGNATRAPVSLNRVRLEGRMLSGMLAAGEGMVATGASDTAELRLWQPGARLFATTSWSPLRNSGDTVRLALMLSSTVFLPLDSVVYAAAVSPLEGCASAVDEEAEAAAHGFVLTAPARWRAGREALEIEVKAPPRGSYSLRVYDLDGLERCVPAHGAVGPARFALAPGACALPPSLPAVILLLRPAGAPPVRARVRLLP